MGETGSAWEVAHQAADGAGVSIRPLTARVDTDDVAALIAEVWAPEAMPPALLRAFQHAGSCLYGAHSGDQLVGFVLGFLGLKDGLHLHSHMLAVAPELQSRGVGYALKLAQRAAALDQGIEEVRWTYDPLIARNARFNLSRLGAVATAFLPDFYGDMPDKLNQGDRSDRFEVRWRLRSAWVERVLRLGAPGMNLAGYRSILKAEGPREAPRPLESGEPPLRFATAEIPIDYQALRARDRDLGRAWRGASSRAFTACSEAGLVAYTFHSGTYFFERPRTTSEWRE